MQNLVIYLLESSVCIVAFYSIYFLFLRNETFFSFIRWYFVVGIIVSIIFPLFDFTYDVFISYPISSMNSDKLVLNDVDPNSSYDFIIFYILIFIYISGCILILIKNFRSYMKLIMLKNESKIFNYSDIGVVDNKNIVYSFSCCRLIFINTEFLNDAEKEMILKHESFHIKQGHWIDLILCQLLTLILWFNPIVWLYMRGVKENHEFLVDRSILNSNYSVKYYIEILLNQSLKNNIYILQNAFNYSLSKRLVMMTKKKSSCLKKVAVLALLPLFSVLIWASAKPNYVMNNFQSIQQDSIKSCIILVNDGKLLVVDGKPYPSLSINMIDTIYIASIKEIDKKNAITKYGENGKNGVLEIELKKGYDYSALKKSNDLSSESNIIIDGKRVTKKELDELDVSKIESFDIKCDTNDINKKNIIVRTKK